jgi:hypothetical protein
MAFATRAGAVAVVIGPRPDHTSGEKGREDPGNGLPQVDSNLTYLPRLIGRASGP